MKKKQHTISFKTALTLSDYRFYLSNQIPGPGQSQSLRRLTWFSLLENQFEHLWHLSELSLYYQKERRAKNNSDTGNWTRIAEAPNKLLNSWKPWVLTITPYRMTQCCLQPKRLFVPYVSSKKDRMERISPPKPNHRLLSNITSTTCCSGSKPLILSALLLVLTFFRQIPSLLLHPVRERWLLCLWSRSTSLQQEVLYSCNIGSNLVDQRWSDPQPVVQYTHLSLEPVQIELVSPS